MSDEIKTARLAPVSTENGGSNVRRTRRPRGKVDPTRVQGAWIISDDTRNALERCELFQDVTRQQLMEVAALVEEHTIEADEMLLTEGEVANHIYVVVEGSGVAQLKLDSGWLSLGLVGPDDAAGWSALVNGQRYPASVKALTPMRVARIETSGLTLLMNVEPKLGYTVLKRVSSIFYRQYEAALKALKTAG